MEILLEYAYCSEFFSLQTTRNCIHLRDVLKDPMPQVKVKEEISLIVEKKLKGCHFMFVLDNLMTMLGKTDVQVLVQLVTNLHKKII